MEFSAGLIVIGVFLCGTGRSQNPKIQRSTYLFSAAVVGEPKIGQPQGSLPKTAGQGVAEESWTEEALFQGFFKKNFEEEYETRSDRHSRRVEVFVFARPGPDISWTKLTLETHGEQGGGVYISWNN